MTNPRRMRVLLITRNLPPLVGGMERLNWHIVDELGRYADVHVIGPVGSAAQIPPGITMSEVPLRPLWRFLAATLWRGQRDARRWRPHVVLAGSGLTALPAWIAAHVCGARAAAYVHGLDVVVRHPLYRALWLPALRRMDRVIANSRSTAALAEQAGIRTEYIDIVHPGVALPAEIPDAIGIAEFRHRHQLGNRPLLLSAGRLTRRKGLVEFVGRALPRIVARHPEVVLVVIGTEATDALHSGGGGYQCVIESAAATAGVAEHIRFLGRCDDDTLSRAYTAAGVHIFPVLDLPGDIEGFGMVALESAAHGVPTVAFEVGGVADAISDGETGHLIPSGDYAGFAEAVCTLLASANSTWSRATCRAFAKTRTWMAFGERLKAILARE